MKTPTNNSEESSKDRIERLKDEIRRVTGEQPVFGTMPGCPPEVEEAFLKKVLAYEQEQARRRS